MTNLPIALQLYTVRDETARDFAGTLRRVAALGYGAVECAGYGNLSVSELLTLLKETGLRVPTSHCLRLDMSQEELAHELAFARQIGCEYVVIPWIGLQRCSSTPLTTLAQQLETIGRSAREVGLQLLYHNHAYSFERLNDSHLLLDDLLAACDPALLGLELDVYWAAYAGIDPAAYLRRYRARIPLLHLKDMNVEREMSEVGDGILDIPGIIAAGEESGVRWLIVEHDHPGMPSLESASRSLHNLTTLA
jgi:sugar phosphate isomerase/epimerase